MTAQETKMLLAHTTSGGSDMSKSVGTLNKKQRKDKGRHFTHCRRGHAFTKENTIIKANGYLKFWEEKHASS